MDETWLKLWTSLAKTLDDAITNVESFYAMGEAADFPPDMHDQLYAAYERLGNVTDLFT